MSKAILVMDMPESCTECQFCREIDEIDACCEIAREPRDESLCRMIGKYDKERPDWCPLKEVPGRDKESHYPDEYMDGFTDGWNRCIDNILE